MAAEYYKHKVTIKEDAKAFIKELKKRNIKVGIGTSNSPELVSVILNKFSLQHTFDAVRTSCEVEKGKPHPDIFLKVAEDLGIEPENCMVFEDVPNGLVAANNAGMKSVAIHDDFSKHMEVEKRELSDFYINTYKEVVDVITKGTKQ
jgi:HAD superfamily hydrolase (TIGR01509 family)